MTLAQKIDKAKDMNINLPSRLLDNDKIVGVYGFFAVKEDKEEYCFYIGKSTNIASRLLDSDGGHVYQYIKGHCSKLVPQKIDEYLKQDYKIEVRILKEIDYHDTSFSKAAHRLALAELQSIVEYQKKGQCEFQTPEGVGRHEKSYWEKNYKGMN